MENKIEEFDRLMKDFNLMNHILTKTNQVENYNIDYYDGVYNFKNENEHVIPFSLEGGDGNRFKFKSNYVDTTVRIGIDNIDDLKRIMRLNYMYFYIYTNKDTDYLKDNFSKLLKQKDVTKVKELA